MVIRTYFYELLLSFFRMLVYEYVNNGNLDQWLHGDVGDVSPLTWEIRVNIILGTAKGYILVLMRILAIESCDSTHVDFLFDFYCLD